MNKYRYGITTLILSVSLAGCSSPKPSAPTKPQSDVTTAHTPASQPQWCPGLRSFKTDSDTALENGDMDQMLLSAAGLQPYDNNPDIMLVITDAFTLYEATQQGQGGLQRKLQSDEEAALASCSS